MSLRIKGAITFKQFGFFCSLENSPVWNGSCYLFAAACLEVVTELLLEFLPSKYTTLFENKMLELLQKGKVPF